MDAVDLARCLYRGISAPFSMDQAGRMMGTILCLICVARDPRSAATPPAKFCRSKQGGLARPHTTRHQLLCILFLMLVIFRTKQLLMQLQTHFMAVLHHRHIPPMSNRCGAKDPEGRSSLHLRWFLKRITHYLTSGYMTELSAWPRFRFIPGQHTATHTPGM